MCQLFSARLLSYIEVVFYWGCLPLRSSSIWGCLPWRLSSIEVFFPWGCLSSNCKFRYFPGWGGGWGGWGGGWVESRIRLISAELKLKLSLAWLSLAKSHILMLRCSFLSQDAYGKGYLPYGPIPYAVKSIRLFDIGFVKNHGVLGQIFDSKLIFPCSENFINIW